MQRLPARSISPVTTALASVQWLFFMFANIVVIPISLGYAFHQPPAVITASLERAFIYTGIACILQGMIGHRLPLMEGSAGLWWGVILSLAAGVQAAGQSLAVLGGTLEVGIILTGLIILLLGVTGLGWCSHRIEWIIRSAPSNACRAGFFVIGQSGQASSPETRLLPSVSAGTFSVFLAACHCNQRPASVALKRKPAARGVRALP